MAMKQPILVGGLGLTAALGIFQTVHHSLVNMGDWTMLGVLAAGGIAWWLQGITQPFLPSMTSPLTREALEKAIATAEASITALKSETESLDSNAKSAINVICENLQEQISKLTAELDRPEVRIAVVGGKNCGKSTLIQLLQANWQEQPQKVIFTEISSLFSDPNWQIKADLVLFVTTGDITDPEFQVIQQLKNSGLRTLLLWNKQDLCLPEERASVLQQQQIRLQETLNLGDVMAISASPAPVKVRRHLEDGSWQEWLEEQTPEIAALTGRLNEILENEAQQLIYSGSLHSVNTIKSEAKMLLNKVRKERALPIIEQSQWIAAAAAFANPVPALDLLATGAITAQLVVDLGGIYKQQFSFEQAKTVAGTMAEFMFKLGLVELSTQTVTHILKSNAITFVAGGAVQGVSAAYLTRIAGLSLIEYFQEQEISAAENRGLNFEQLKNTLQSVFQQNQRKEFLQSFVRQGIGRLMPDAKVPV
ncbi:DUF697 domain-containing protein [Ancylothrix sp. C2]|uniref:slr1306 family protein n=1 Tax=Ancylothrix sp. D3o TaxID=2953691 RepID=UPI0021BA53E2|nr:DUF697 domain-containing protein [Ancylothrix sp. D3o]MCT7950163.1 DUF697 domain-containing protein [Ancylothrix sp. D3o]